MSPESLNAVVFAARLARNEKAPLGPVVERCTSKPLSFDELSCHERSIRLINTAMAVRFDGAFTVDAGAPGRPSKMGSSGCLRSQETESDRIAIRMNTGRTTMEPSREGLLASSNTVVGRTIVEGLLGVG